MQKLLVVGACLLSAVIGAEAANASLVPTLSSITAQSDGTYLYTYDLKLTGDQGLSTSAIDPLSGRSFNSAITIFDFAGYVAGSASVAFNSALDAGGGFTASTPNTTDTTFLATVPGEVDDAAIPNLTFTYTGPDFRTTGGGTGASSAYPDVFIAQLSAVSVYNNSAYTSFSGVGVKNTGTSTAATAAFNAGTTLAPSAVTSNVPEAATWAMMVFGFGAVGAGLRTRRSAPAIADLG